MLKEIMKKLTIVICSLSIHYSAFGQKKTFPIYTGGDIYDYVDGYELDANDGEWVLIRLNDIDEVVVLKGGVTKDEGEHDYIHKKLYNTKFARWCESQLKDGKCLIIGMNDGDLWSDIATCR